MNVRKNKELNAFGNYLSSNIQIISKVTTYSSWNKNTTNIIFVPHLMDKDIYLLALLSSLAPAVKSRLKILNKF